MSSDAAKTEAERLLRMAVSLLDSTGCFLAAAYVDHAIEHLAESVSAPIKDLSLSDLGMMDPLPGSAQCWNEIVER
ncbi:hypothetical protein OVA07_14770 [Novosphingobium sp. SL115]|uniref:hypothetical protein n=1 Tax=Novosphingobium sp. SL115 TaxID=2995150 RepID=UPI002276A38E|nr:hypothetical protein [Novosphingobium sp. SL115]MCY1672267.1 hypothetical protein [Novosphingobium sp. SL115]